MMCFSNLFIRLYDISFYIVNLTNLKLSYPGINTKVILLCFCFEEIGKIIPLITETEFIYLLLKSNMNE